MNDPRIGVVGQSEPRVCAVSGRPIKGKHALTHHIGSGFYVRVLSQYDHQWSNALDAELRLVVTPVDPAPQDKKGKS